MTHGQQEEKYGVTHRIFHAISDFFKSIFHAAYNYAGDFFHGDRITKLSYFIMGFGHIMRRQRLKGAFFLISQVLFCVYMYSFGLKYITLFSENIFSHGTLGRVQTQISDVWDAELGEYVKTVGDNSFHIVLYGILSFLILLAFLLLYFASVKQSRILAERQSFGIIEKGGGLTSLLDSRLHIPLLSLPMLGLFIFTLVPLLAMICIAFTNYDADHEVPERLFSWVGTENFSEMISFGSSLGGTFRRVLVWTLVWAFFATFSNYFFGMLLALAINQKNIFGKKLYRTLFVSTIAVPQFVSLLIMSKMLDSGGGGVGGGGGIITRFVEYLTGYHLQFGLDTTTTRILIILVNMWIGIPYSMLICSGILMNIPASLNESARIDGAGRIRRFMKITLPYMLFVTGPYLITQFIGNINNFNVIYLLSGGGPGNVAEYSHGAKSTDLLITWLYKLSIGTDRNYKLASVIGILVFIISSVFSLIVYNRSSAVKDKEDFS